MGQWKVFTGFLLMCGVVSLTIGLLDYLFLGAILQMTLRQSVGIMNCPTFQKMLCHSTVTHVPTE
jgi:hypothetical protein